MVRVRARARVRVRVRGRVRGRVRVRGGKQRAASSGRRACTWLWPS